MSKYIRHLGVPTLIVALAALAACRSDAKRSDSTALGADTTLNRDLALANRDTAAQPQLTDVPNTPPPKTPAATRPAPSRRTAERPRTHENRPAPTPPPPVPATTTTPSGNTVTANSRASAANAGGGAVGTIAAGTTLNTHASSKICTNTNQVGDHVTATLDNSVPGTNGAMIPAGATVHLTVTSLKRSENANDPIVMEFAVNSVSFGGKTYPIEASVASAAVDRVRDESTGKDVQKVGIGAAVGAIAGRIFGKSTKATVIGGAVGAAAGAATAAATSNYQGCIQSGGSIVVKLNAPATVRA
ncbi:MAG: hypothetical protein ACREPM_02920 [Gemmatimonadaceae bacterium]